MSTILRLSWPVEFVIQLINSLIINQLIAQVSQLLQGTYTMLCVIQKAAFIISSQAITLSIALIRTLKSF